MNENTLQTQTSTFLAHMNLKHSKAAKKKLVRFAGLCSYSVVKRNYFPRKSWLLNIFPVIQTHQDGYFRYCQESFF